MAVKLFFKDKHPFGLDISQTGVKLMAVDPSKWLVRSFGSLDLDPTKLQKALDSTDPEDTFLADSIRRLMEENLTGNLPSNHVAIGLPTSRSFSRTFSLPIAEEKNLANAVEVECSQYIPIPQSSLYLDYEVIDKDKSQIQVIMSAIPKTIVDNVIKASTQAGLRPVLVEPSINAVARLLELTEEGNLSTLIVDIGQAYTDIAVLDHQAIRVTGGLAIGGNTFTLDIAKKMNVALDNAHQLKVLYGLNLSPKQAKISIALKPSLTRISNEIRKVIRYYNERISKSVKIEQVVVVGAGSNVPGIGDYFTNDLVMPARVASPWQQLDFGSFTPPSKQFRPRYIAVAGLASIKYQELWK
jgi:type IV pilus assembly protein PilM